MSKPDCKKEVESTVNNTLGKKACWVGEPTNKLSSKKAKKQVSKEDSSILKKLIEELTSTAYEKSEKVIVPEVEKPKLSEIANQEVLRCYYSLGKVLSQRFKYHFEKSYNKYISASF
ncbi:hypothetical protein Glove_165g6 [Diversispora epigaea]|uniref:Uncharacterized protein n=1 Tax=Diversispora epigaea TaxID=1348612 RepID=A0A397IVI6_9GLOM|nr:hypothetical protein Glove_165g6 [Diversispora epigaea]